MRKLMLAAAIAALGAAVLAAPAVAFDHHFTVHVKVKSIHLAGPNAFVVKHRLLDQNNRSSKVGRDRFKNREKGHNKSKCHGLIHLNGKIGGVGNIRVKGDLHRGDNRLVVLGGTRQFNGVAGKLTVQRGRLHFDLVR